MATGRTPEERFVNEIQSLRERITQLESRPLQIPYLDADPSVDYRGNVWMFQDGRVRVRLPDGTIKELATVASTGTTSGTPKPPVIAQPTTKIVEKSATWSQAYRQSGGFTGSNSTYLYYGSSGDSYNGRQSSLIGFDYASIAATLVGATIIKVELFLDNLHTWANAGGTVYIGMHSNAAKPGSFGGVVKNQVSSFGVKRNQQAFHAISTEFGQRLKDGSIKGVILQAPNSSQSFYGYAAGVGSGQPVPRLKITYRS